MPGNDKPIEREGAQETQELRGKQEAQEIRQGQEAQAAETKQEAQEATKAQDAQEVQELGEMETAAQARRKWRIDTQGQEISPGLTVFIEEMGAVLQKMVDPVLSTGETWGNLANAAMNTPRQELEGQTMIDAFTRAGEQIAAIGKRETETGRIMRDLAHSLTEVVQNITRETTTAYQKIADFMQGDTFQGLGAKFKPVQAWYKEALDNADLGEILFLSGITDENGERIQALFAALDRLEKEDPAAAALEDLTLAELLEPGPVDPATGLPGLSIMDRAAQAAQERAEEKEKAIEALNQPRKEIPGQLMLNSNMATYLPGFVDKKTGLKMPVVNSGGWDIPVLPGVTNYLMATIEESKLSYRGERPFTETDQDVLNAALTLIYNGYKTFTADTVHQVRFSREKREYRKGAAKVDDESIKILKETEVVYDATEEFRKRYSGGKGGSAGRINGKDIVSWKDKGHKLLELGELVATDTDGQEYTIYTVKKEPLILSYSLATNQILTFTSRQMDIRRVDKKGAICESVYIDEQRRVILCYVLRRIAVMKRDKKNQKKNQKQADNILFDTLYSECCIDPQNKTELSRARQFVFSVLDYEKAIGYIAGYDIEKQGNKYRSVYIKLAKQTPQLKPGR